MAAALWRVALAAALAALAVGAPVEEALATDDECAAGADCGLEALQHRKEVKVGVAQTEAPAISHEALLQAMAADGVPEEHLEEARAELAATAKLSAAEIEARSNGTCTTWTGGTCTISSCAASRGATECSAFRCVCRSGFCEQNGVCRFNTHRATQQYAGAWGAPTTGSWGMPGGSSWGAPAPTATAGWGAAWGAPSPSAGWGAPSAWGTPGTVGSTSSGRAGNRDTGGTCMLGDCDRSRGDTHCSHNTGFKCMCRKGSRVVRGRCVFR
uniref:EGF-like domain-containing protein n=1 Tax=Alexandrium catenella TaxID=2925 RepID=A0A7S1LKV1_ALECA